MVRLTTSWCSLALSLMMAHRTIAAATTSTTSTTPNSGAPVVYSDLALTNDMKTEDFDNEKSPLRKLIQYLVQGSGPASTYFSIITKDKELDLGIKITDDSIFVPGGNEANKQVGFRRADCLPVTAPAAFQGVTTFYHSFRLDAKFPLNTTHGYLLGSTEIKTGNHPYDFFTGSDFDSKNVAATKTPNSETIRVRDLSTKTLYSVPLNYKDTYHFGITVDWDKSTLSVAASTNEDSLKLVGGPYQNVAEKLTPKKVEGCEFHGQLIKFPVPNPHDPEADRGDVPHKGLQPSGIKEQIVYTRLSAIQGPFSPSQQTAGQANCKTKPRTGDKSKKPPSQE